MLMLTMEAVMGDCSEAMQMGIPYHTIDPIIKSMQEKNSNFNRLNASKKTSRWHEPYDDIDVPIYAEWDAFEISTRDLLNLRAGDVIELPKDIIKQTRVRLHNTTYFVGEAGLEEDRVAVKITGVFDQE